MPSAVKLQIQPHSDISIQANKHLGRWDQVSSTTWKSTGNSNFLPITVCLTCPVCHSPQENISVLPEACLHLPSSMLDCSIPSSDVDYWVTLSKTTSSPVVKPGIKLTSSCCKSGWQEGGIIMLLMLNQSNAKVLLSVRNCAFFFPSQNFTAYISILLPFMSSQMHCKQTWII